MVFVLNVAQRPVPRWKPGDDDGTEKIRLDVSCQKPTGDVFIGKGCVLIVDDDESCRETLAELLEDDGFSSRQAGDATEAMIILRQDRTIGALVTDLTMPGQDGIALIRQAREMRSELPAILLTGYAEEVTSVTTLAGGNFPVLRKPVEIDRLIQQLEMLVFRPEA